MRLIGFMKNGKGTLHEPEELFAAAGTVEVVKTLEGGISVIQVQLNPEGKVEKRGRKPKNPAQPLTAAPHTDNPAE